MTAAGQMTVPGPIPWTAINEWYETHEVGSRDRFERLIRRMDEAWLQAESANTADARTERPNPEG